MAEQVESWQIRGGRLLDPYRNRDEILDVWIVDGKIVALGRDFPPIPGAQIVPAEGCLVVPGLIDLHVHLREPGQTHKETIASGTQAAAAGGFTQVVCMANTDPPLDHPDKIRWVRERAAAVGHAQVWPVGTISLRLEGKEPAPWSAMAQAGAVGFSDDGKSTACESVMRAVLEQSNVHGWTVLVHCEDPSLSQGGVIHAGTVAKQLGVPGIPPEAEERILERDLRLAAETGGRLHVQHVTTARGVEMIRNAKRTGVPVTAEATPHHFTLTHEAVLQHGPDAKMNPPLRTETDRQALIAGLQDGTIDVIATDHAPHHPDEKAQGLREAPFGIIGLELCFPLTWTILVQEGHLSPMDAVEKLTVAPARVMGFSPPRLEIGQPATLTVIDITHSRPVTPECIYSKSRNTPFWGWKLTGWPLLTFWNGTVTFRRGERNAGVFGA